MFKVTLLSHQLDGRLGTVILFSMSHIAGDGYTFFTLLNGFFDQTKMVSLNFKRHLNAKDAIERFVGKKNLGFLYSTTLLIKGAYNLVFGKKVKCVARFLDEEYIELEKKAYKENDGSLFPYLSTHDIVTSKFCHITDSRIAMMLMNLRNNIEGIGDIDAGNYQAAIFLDKNIYQTPESVKQYIKNLSST